MLLSFIYKYFFFLFRVKLAGFSHTKDSTNFPGIHHVGGDGETFMEKRRRLLLV